MSTTLTSSVAIVEMGTCSAPAGRTAHGNLNKADGTVAQPFGHRMTRPPEHKETTAEITVRTDQKNRWDVTAAQCCTRVVVTRSVLVLVCLAWLTTGAVLGVVAGLGCSP